MADPLPPSSSSRVRRRSSTGGAAVWTQLGATDTPIAPLIVGLGAITLALGIVVLVWSGQTLLVLAVLIAVQLLVTGVGQILLLVTSEEGLGGTRALSGLLGALAFLVGVLCLRAPLQTLTAISVLIGSWWIVSGVLILLSGLAQGTDRVRLWASVTGPLTFAAGTVVLLQPQLSLPTLAVIVGFWFLVQGVLTIVLGIGYHPRAERSAQPAARAD